MSISSNGSLLSSRSFAQHSGKLDFSLFERRTFFYTDVSPKHRLGQTRSASLPNENLLWNKRSVKLPVVFLETVDQYFYTMKYPKDFFEKFEKKLADMAAKGVPKSANSIKSGFKRLWPFLEKCIQKGYTHQELFETATGLGLKCSFSSFKVYLAAAHGKKKKRKPKQQKTVAKKATKTVVSGQKSAQLKSATSTSSGQQKGTGSNKPELSANQQDELFD